MYCVEYKSSLFLNCPQFRLANLLIDGIYMGVFWLGLEIVTKAIDLSSLEVIGMSGRLFAYSSVRTH